MVDAKTRKQCMSTGNKLKTGLEGGGGGEDPLKKIFAKLKTHRHTWELFYFQQVLKVVTKLGRVKKNNLTLMSQEC